MAKLASAFLAPAIHACCVGVGALIAGPLGAATGGFVGPFVGDFVGKSLEGLAEKGVEDFIAKASEDFFDKGGDSLVERFKKSGPTLEAVYREAYRRSLTKIRTRAAPEDALWFKHWHKALQAGITLRLEEAKPAQLQTIGSDAFFRTTMERLDAQGAQSQANDLSLDLKTRPLPGELFELLKARLPETFEEEFSKLIAEPEQAQAWVEAQRLFQNRIEATVQESNLLVRVIDTRTARIETQTSLLPAMDTRLAGIEQMLLAQQAAAVQEGRISAQDFKSRDEEIARLTQLTVTLQAELAKRSSDPTEAKISGLIASGDIEEAFKLKTQQVERRKEEAKKLPRDLSELAQICELRFDWEGALDNYRQAWELSRDPRYGFQYALFAAKLNHHNEAIKTYEALLTSTSESADRAKYLNNLAVLYRATQRLAEAETACSEALATYRGLAGANPGAYLPDVAMTLNNLAFLQFSQGSIDAAEASVSEAEKILEPFWQANPELHGNQMAKTLLARCLMDEAAGAVGEACKLAHRASAAAYDPEIKEAIQEIVDRLCPAPGAEKQEMNINFVPASSNSIDALGLCKRARI
jgi:tetratricopeptide (TPR) repeat protein